MNCDVLHIRFFIDSEALKLRKKPYQHPESCLSIVSRDQPDLTMEVMSNMTGCNTTVESNCSNALIPQG